MQKEHPIETPENELATPGPDHERPAEQPPDRPECSDCGDHLIACRCLPGEG